MRNKIFAILLLALIFFPGFVQAADCSPDGASPDGRICRPSQFFVDLSAVNSKYSNDFAGLFLFLVESSLTIVAILSIAFIVWGGYQYITSAGNEERSQAGKKTLSNAIIGLVIVVLSYIIVTVLINLLKGSP